MCLITFLQGVEAAVMTGETEKYTEICTGISFSGLHCFTSVFSHVCVALQVSAGWVWPPRGPGGTGMVSVTGKDE